MKCCLIGEKLGHSYSKIIHDKFGAYDYELVEVKKEDLADFVKNGKFDAFNVTIPYKQDVISMLDYVDESALEIGAVNTVCRKNGKTYGYNTDFAGMKYMLSSAGIELFGKNVLILGGGGTSKTSVAVSRSLGAKSINVVSRSGKVNYENCYDLIDAEVIINATPVGMYPNVDGIPIDLAKFPKVSAVVDVIYNPLNTRLLIEAQKLNLKYVGGLIMLVAQAKFALDIFTGVCNSDSVIDDMYASLLKNTMNVVFVGMPGSGKTSVGKATAKALGKQFVDLDKKIIEKAGMSIPEIFERFGEKRFREVEKQVVAEVGKGKGLIVSTGGGVVLDYGNYYSLKANGFIVYIDRGLDKLATKGRPLSKNKEALEEMMLFRKPKYEAFADVKVDNNAGFYECVNKVVEVFNESFDN